jgi:hypothetical protein
MRAITTKYMGPTNTRGSRVKVSDPGYALGGGRARSITVSWDDALDPRGNFAAAAREALAKWEWDGTWIAGSLDTGDVFVCVSARGPLTVHAETLTVDPFAALVALAKWATTGNRTGNPYCIPEVKDALRAVAALRGMPADEYQNALEGLAP